MQKSIYNEIHVKGTPEQRGKAYAENLGKVLPEFFQNNVLEYFLKKGLSREQMSQYAMSCKPSLEKHVPGLLAEIESTAKYSGLGLEDMLISICHEELYHRRSAR
jgi:hypothetical protein